MICTSTHKDKPVIRCRDTVESRNRTCEKRKERIAQLKAENERLLKMLTAYAEEIGRLEMKVLMMERANAIIEDCADDYNALPIEERKRIGRFMNYEKILTVVQMIEKDRTHTTEAWRTKQRAWLTGLVSSYEHDERRRMNEEAEERSEQ